MDTIVRGQKTVAEHFGITERQVRNWKKQGMPYLSGGRYDLMQIRLWRDQKQGIGPGTVTAEAVKQPEQLNLGGKGKDFEDARMKKARADLLELDLRQRRGELIERQEVEQLFRARIKGVTQGLESLSRALPPQLIHCQTERDMEAVITQAVRALREAFARPLPQHLASGEKSGGSGR